MQIQSQKRKAGIIAPKRFVQRLKKDNELFRSYMHQVTCTGMIVINMSAWTFDWKFGQ